ncbi:hypothetical protein DFH28DRAFT_333182 [Melampsora americana]|nr:hypothetical protein DFH28DRAFT_333182 [Melampsora americana]
MDYHLSFLLILLYLTHSLSCSVSIVDQLKEDIRVSTSTRSIEVFKPFNLHPDSLSSLSSNCHNKKSIGKNPQLSQTDLFNKILSLNSKIPGWHDLDLGLRDLSSHLDWPFPWFFSTARFNSGVFGKGEQFEQSIQKSIRLLEDHALVPKERIWVLTVLSHLQGYLPNGELIPMVTNFEEGPIGYAELQLHLTRGLNLLEASELLWGSEEAPKLVKIDPSLAEVMLRLKLIKWIKSQFRNNQANSLSKFLVEIYDFFLQERCPMHPERFKSFLLLCSSHVRGMDISNELVLEERLAYTVLQLYAEIYPTVKEFREEEKLRNNQFRVRFEFEDVFQDISSALERRTLGGFKDLVSPFLKFENWNMNSFKNAIDTMIHARQKGPRWGETSTTTYASKESTVIKNLLCIANHIDGAKPYIDAKVEQISRS